MSVNIDTLKNLINIGTDIIQKKDVYEYDTMKTLMNISIDTIKIDSGIAESRFGFFSNLFFPKLPEQTLRFKNIEISIGNENYYDADGNEIKPEGKPFKIIATITPMYGESGIKINTYKIVDGENIVDELDLGEINLTDLRNPEKKPEIIKNIVENLKEKYDIEDSEVQSIQEYLNKLGESVSKLKINVEGLDHDVNTLQQNISNNI